MGTEVFLDKQNISKDITILAKCWFRTVPLAQLCEDAVCNYMWCSKVVFFLWDSSIIGEQNSQWPLGERLLSNLISLPFCLCLCVFISQMLPQLCFAQRIIHRCSSGAQSLASTNVDVVTHLQGQRGKFSHQSYYLSDDEFTVLLQENFFPWQKQMKTSPLSWFLSPAAHSHSGSTVHCLHNSTDTIIYKSGL